MRSPTCAGALSPYDVLLLFLCNKEDWTLTWFLQQQLPRTQKCVPPFFKMLVIRASEMQLLLSETSSLNNCDLMVQSLIWSCVQKRKSSRCLSFCCSLLASIFMAYGNSPDLSPWGNLPVCNNEKPAESGETTRLSCFFLMSTAMRLYRLHK